MQSKGLLFGLFPPFHGIPVPLLLIGFIIMGIYVIGAGCGGILLIGNEDNGTGEVGNDAGEDAGEQAALEDLHVQPYPSSSSSSSFCNGTTKGKRGGVWAGTGRDRDKIKRKSRQISRIQISPGGATPGTLIGETGMRSSARDADNGGAIKDGSHWKPRPRRGRIQHGTGPYHEHVWGKGQKIRQKTFSGKKENVKMLGKGCMYMFG